VLVADDVVAVADDVVAVAEYAVVVTHDVVVAAPPHRRAARPPAPRPPRGPSRGAACRQSGAS